MCTALSFTVDDQHYFGRNLDLEQSVGEQIVIAPSNFHFHFNYVDDLNQHYALLGIAPVMDGVPLFCDAINEQGLAMAGLNYPGNSYYRKPQSGKTNVASFELISFLLGQCKNVQEVRQLLHDMVICDDAFKPGLQPTPLHWLIADKKEAVVLESDRDGVHLYDDPVGVLTNNPRFPLQLFNLNNYRTLSADTLANSFAPQLDLADYSRGLGTINLPGGIDSESRFVRAAFNKYNATWPQHDEVSNVTELFHVMHSVEQASGTDQVGTDLDQFEYTVYTAGYNLDQGYLYYTTYTNNRINKIDMHQVDLNSDQLTVYPFMRQQEINSQN